MTEYISAQANIAAARRNWPDWATDPIRPMFNGAQLWVCKVCGKPRQWGEGCPLEITNEDAWLRCLKCDAVTLHFYGGVHHGWAKSEDPKP
jgi:hypothetical protein